MKFRLAVATVLALVVGAWPLLAGDPIGGNTFEKGPRWMFADTLSVPGSGRRTIYLVVPTTGTVVSNPDSVVNVWYTTGTPVPSLRLMRSLNLHGTGTADVRWTLSVFSGGATTANMTVVVPGAAGLVLPLEADSVQVTNPTLSSQTLIYVVW